jgi:hypothetical protein
MITANPYPSKAMAKTKQGKASVPVQKQVLCHYFAFARGVSGHHFSKQVYYFLQTQPKKI